MSQDINKHRCVFYSGYILSNQEFKYISSPFLASAVLTWINFKNIYSKVRDVSLKSLADF
jgi:hypothetical protein